MERQPDAVGDINEQHVYSRDDANKDGRSKDEKHRDERHKDKYSGEVDRENRHRDDKQKDEHAARDQITNRYDDKHLRDEKETVEIRQKKSKPHNGDRDRYNYRNRERERDRDYERNREYTCDKDRDRDHARNRHRDRDRDRSHDHVRDWEWDHDRDRNFDQDHDCALVGNNGRDRGRDQNFENESATLDDRSTRSKDSRGKKRSSGDFDDFTDSKSRVSKTYLDSGKRSASDSRTEFDADRGRSQSILTPMDKNANSNRQHYSPNTCSYGAQDENRETVTEPRTKGSSSREGISLLGSSERVSKFKSGEKPVRMDDGHVRELSQERSSSSKALPMALVDKSSPSPSFERRLPNRSFVRRSMDNEESGKRAASSTGARDLYFGEDQEKHVLDDLTSSDSPFHSKGSQNHSGSIPSSFRGGIGSPALMSSMEDDIEPMLFLDTKGVVNIPEDIPEHTLCSTCLDNLVTTPENILEHNKRKAAISKSVSMVTGVPLKNVSAISTARSIANSSASRGEDAGHFLPLMAFTLPDQSLATAAMPASDR